MPTVIWKSERREGVPVKRRTLLQPIGWQVSVHSHPWSPPTDMYETESDYIVRVEVAGMRQQDFSVTLDDSYLVITGSRPDQAERKAYHQMEIRFGEFSTILALPGPVDQDRVEATYEDGFLTITLAKPRTTTVNIK